MLHYNKMPLATLRTKLEYYGPLLKGGATFPIAFLINLLENANHYVQTKMEEVGREAEESKEWVYRTMKKVKVPFYLLFRSYVQLLDVVSGKTEGSNKSLSGEYIPAHFAYPTPITGRLAKLSIFHRRWRSSRNTGLHGRKYRPSIRQTTDAFLR